MAQQFLSAILDTYRPDLIPLAHNLHALTFPLMKVFPAAHSIFEALENGQLRPGDLVIESSSGTMALGLAIICRLMDLRLRIVSDYACDRSLRRRMEDLGARVELVAAPGAVGGYQGARLHRVHEICAAARRHWWVNQYDNPANSAAYYPIADELMKSCERVDCLIGSVGSGGSMSGLSRRLRQRFPSLYVIGVDTGGSVLFGQPDTSRTLRGLGNSLVPQNLDHALFDEVHWVSAAEAYTATRLLHRATTLFRGGTSGACWMVACHWAQNHPDSKTVCVFPDEGQRYSETIYDDDYLMHHSLWLDSLPASPVKLQSPCSVTTTWSRYPWNRRTLDQVKAESLLKVSP